jgi:hypothetical protein
MKRQIIHLFLGLALLAGLLQSCGDPITSRAASRGRMSFRQWLRYEFQQVKSFSYGNSQIKENQHVIGYEPSWLIYDSLYLNYPYQLMSDLVVGEYDLNTRTGFPRNDSAFNAFRRKDIVEMATGVNSQMNVMIALTDYGDQGYRNEFLKEIPKKNLLNTLDLTLDELNLKRNGEQEREKVGILVDFPKVYWNNRYEFAEFLARIKKDLDNRELGKTCLLYLVLPCDEDFSGLYQDSIFSQRVRENVDLFVLRTHRFDEVGNLGDWKGPMMPIDRTSERIDIDSLVNFYTKKGKIPRSKITLEVPYYATVWSTDSTISGSRPLIPLNELFNTIEAPRVADTHSVSFTLKVDTTTYFYQDTLSLELAYRWVNKQKLAGIGLYGLGYGQGIDNAVIDQRLWEIVAENFAEPAPRLLFPGVGFLLCFLGVGVVGSVIVNWQVRYALREKRTKFWFYLGFLCCVILAVVLCALPIKIVPIMWKLISLAVLLVFPLGRKAFKYFFKAAA